jgi:hypothetical protein
VVLRVTAVGFLAKRAIKNGVFIIRLAVFKVREEEGDVERLTVDSFF